MTKKKSDSSVGYVEPGMTLVIGVKEGEWKELKQYRDEGIFFQLGTSLIAFSASILLAILTTNISNRIMENTLWCVLGGSFVAGLLLLFLWWKEKKKKNNVVKRVEGRAKEQYGNDIDL